MEDDRLRCQPRVSVVVPARNSAPTLPKLFDALAWQTAPPGLFEVIVVDDGSSDATADVVRRHLGVRLMEAPGHVGVAASRNLGIRAARGEVLAFVDADCLPTPTWVERGLAALEELGADLLAGHIDVAVARPTPLALVDLTHYFDQQRYVAEGFAATGNLWARRQILLTAGRFDERLARGEDRELCTRAVEAGARLLYAPDVVVIHPARGVTAQVRRSFGTGTDRGLAGLRARARQGAYVTSERARARLAGAGYSPTATRMLGIRVAKNACIRVPMALGALWGALSSKRRSERGPDAAC
jgi:hypothetical protein